MLAIMTPQQIACARCHALLAELIELSVVLDGKIVASAHDEEHALQVVIFLTRWDRPRFVPAPGIDPHGNPIPDPTPRQKPIVAAKDHGAEIRTCIMEAGAVVPHAARNHPPPQYI